MLGETTQEGGGERGGCVTGRKVVKRAAFSQESVGWRKTIRQKSSRLGGKEREGEVEFTKGCFLLIGMKGTRVELRGR